MHLQPLPSVMGCIEYVKLVSIRRRAMFACESSLASVARAIASHLELVSFPDALRHATRPSNSRKVHGQSCFVLSRTAPVRVRIEHDRHQRRRHETPFDATKHAARASMNHPSRNTGGGSGQCMIAIDRLAMQPSRDRCCRFGARRTPCTESSSPPRRAVSLAFGSRRSRADLTDLAGAG